MNFLTIFIIIIVINTLKAEPITIALATSTFFGISSYFWNLRLINCIFQECCEPNSKWLLSDMKKLEEDLNQKLHGQHLVKLVLSKHLKSHIMQNQPSKALLLSFNGMTGTGKNFVSTLIANSTFRYGMNSKFVHLFISNVHFPSESEKEIETYKVNLQKHIMESVRRCPRSIFIFDEVQDMPGNLLDAIAPFVEYHESIDGIDFRKAIFILLGNSGSKDIYHKILEMHMAGISREDITLKDMEVVLSKSLYKIKNDSLYRSKLIYHHLITAYVPFLPLNRYHVELCVRNILKTRGLAEDPDKIREVLDSLHFDKVNGLEFSRQGCKRVPEKIDLVF